MAFDKGALILVEYTARIKDTGEVFDTTIKGDAVAHSIHEPSTNYMPKLVSIGESWVLKGLDEGLAETSAGDRLSIEVAPDKGFGQRDPGKVRMIPLRKLGEDAEKVSVGDTVEIDNRKGTIRLIGSGRVQIDFNHRYAGRTLVYDVHVVKSLDTDSDKIGGILQHHLQVEHTSLQFESDGEGLDIEIPEEMFRTDGLQTTKHLIQLDIFKFVPSLKAITFMETYENKARRYDEPEAKEQNLNSSIPLS